MPVADPPVTNQLMSAIKRTERIFSQPLSKRFPPRLNHPPASLSVAVGPCQAWGSEFLLELLTCPRFLLF